jgi:predicted HTH domain antitoxin
LQANITLSIHLSSVNLHNSLKIFSRVYIFLIKSKRISLNITSESIRFKLGTFMHAKNERMICLKLIFFHYLQSVKFFHLLIHYPFDDIISQFVFFKEVNIYFEIISMPWQNIIRNLYATDIYKKAFWGQLMSMHFEFLNT